MGVLLELGIADPVPALDTPAVPHQSQQAFWGGAQAGEKLIVYGHTPTHVVVNDPWGEPDLIHVTTLNAKGMGMRFSRLNFGKRWMVVSIGGGAYRYAPGKGWAVVVDSIG
jgi:hypothetical protein